MPTNQTKINTEKRKEFYQFVESRSKLMYEEFAEAEREITDKIVKSEKKGKIKMYLALALILFVRRRFSKLRKRTKQIIIGSFLTASKHGVNDSIKDVSKFATSKMKIDAKPSIATEAAAITKSYNLGGITLSRRIWDVTWSSQKRIMTEIHLAVLRGDSSAVLAKKLKGFLGVSRKVTTGLATQIETAPGMYKSAYKNALRLARTEINRAYAHGVYRYGKSKKWIDGYIWRVASGNPCEDCLDNNGVFYPKEEPPEIPLHPHCMCYPEIHYTEYRI